MVTFTVIFGKFQSTKNISINLQKYLDPSQLNAINQSLSNKISLIQGPPCTGKTYVGTILVRLLLELEQNSKILIVSYTNHALDSFLEEIVEYRKALLITPPESRKISKIFEGGVIKCGKKRLF